MKNVHIANIHTRAVKVSHEQPRGPVYVLRARNEKARKEFINAMNSVLAWFEKR